MKKKSLFLLIFAAPFNSYATNIGYYIGADIGPSWIGESSCNSNSSCDNQAFAVGLYTGYQFNDYFALEASYANYGNIDSVSNDNQIFDGNFSLLSFEPKVSYPLNEFLSVYAKLGVSQVYYGSSQDTVISTGAGFDIDAAPNWTVRLGYETTPNIIDNDEGINGLSASSIMLGLHYTFSQYEEVVAPTEPVEQETEIAIAPVELPEINHSVYFLFDSSELMNDTKDELTYLAETLKLYPERKVELTGYSDDTGPNAYNKKLTEKRILRVQDFLLELGVQPEQLEIINKGSNWQGASDKPLWKNRKVIITDEMETTQ